jgi:hypothetical protein
MTRKMMLSLSSQTQRSRTRKLYPFLRAAELRKVDSRDASGDPLLSYSGGERPVSHAGVREPPKKEPEPAKADGPPKEVRSLPSVRRGGSKKKRFAKDG